MIQDNKIPELDNFNYVDCAKDAIENLDSNKVKKDIISSNQIRKILSLNSVIYNDVIYRNENEQLSEEIIGRINYLKVRILYDSTREKTVKNFVEQTHLIEHIERVITKKQKQYYLLFSQYLEALVAFRAYVFGEEKN